MATESETAAWFDVHCHVLPGIDDGCRTVQESVQLMKQLWKQGVRGIVATPHYYPKESIPEFLLRRARAEQCLREQMLLETDLPQLCCGAEAAYHPGLAFDENLEAICMGGSRYLLLELPFAPWPPKVLRDIVEMIGRGFTPIIAHVERYLEYQTSATMQELFELDVLIQMNAEAIAGRWKGRGARRLIQKGRIDLLGSDAHNLTSRPPNLGKITARLRDGRLRDELEAIRQQNYRVFGAALEKEAEVMI